MPILMGLPPGPTLSCAAEVPLAALVVGDCFTVNGAWKLIELAVDMAEDALGFTWPRFACGPLGRPAGAAPASRAPPPTLEGGNICDGWSTRDFLTTGGATAWTTA